MASILAWLMTRIQQAENLALSTLPQILQTIFSEAGFTTTLTSNILADVTSFATNALGSLGLVQYVRAWLKAWESFCNRRPVSATTTLQWQIVLVGIQLQNALIRQAGTNARLCLAWLQPLVDDAETANAGSVLAATAAAVVLAQGNRDAAAEYLEACEAAEELASQGVTVVVPAAPAIIATTLAAISASMNTAPVAGSSGVPAVESVAPTALALTAANGSGGTFTPASAQTPMAAKALASGQMQLTVG